MKYAVFMAHPQTALIPESFAAGECQSISLIKLYPNGEYLCNMTHKINLIKNRS